MIAIQSSISLKQQQISRRSHAAFRTFSPHVIRYGGRRTGSLVITAYKGDDDERSSSEVEKAKQDLVKGGLTKEIASKVLEAWRQEAGHEVQADDLRKVLTRTSTRFTGFLLLQMLLDAGAAYGAFVGGNLLGTGVEQYGFLAVALQAVAYIFAGYYAAGVAIDFFKLGTLLVALVQFNVKSATFLEAVKELAGRPPPTGLTTLDKAREAVNMVKVLQALLKISDMLQKEQVEGGASGGPPDMLRDLGAYLTLERAQRSFGFDAASAGLTDQQATNIALKFSKFDTNDDGVLSVDEFKRLCAEYAPELSDPEVRAGFSLLDTNRNSQVEFREFVDWWLKKVELPPSEREGEGSQGQDGKTAPAAGKQ